MPSKIVDGNQPLPESWGFAKATKTQCVDTMRSVRGYERKSVQ